MTLNWRLMNVGRGAATLVDGLFNRAHCPQSRIGIIGNLNLLGTIRTEHEVEPT